MNKPILLNDWRESCLLICLICLHLNFGVRAEENQDKVPTLYWLLKLHKIPIKQAIISNSSSCSTTELSKLLTSSLSAVKNML